MFFRPFPPPGPLPAPGRAGRYGVGERPARPVEHHRGTGVAKEAAGVMQPLCEISCPFSAALARSTFVRPLLPRYIRRGAILRGRALLGKGESVLLGYVGGKGASAHW